MDMQPEGREKVIAYLKKKYGYDHVFQVANHSELKAKSAIRDVARFYNYSFDQSDAITKQIPTKFTNDDGEDITPTIKEVVEMPQIKPFVEQDETLFNVAGNLEGSYRSAGRHAGAVVITAKPVTEIIPVMRAAGNKSDDDEFAELQTQWDKKQLEKVNIHKYDILGLTTLTTINKLEKLTGVKSLEIPFDDPKTWKFLKEAKHMEGVFQLSSNQMKGWCRKIIPPWKKGATNLIDYLSDINAINRPAVLDAGLGDKYVENVKNGSYELPYDFPFIREILDETNGITLYQEQTMRIVNAIAGMSLGEGDLLRRNLENMGTAGKKTEKVIKENKEFREKFIKGAKEKHNLDQKTCEGLWWWLSDSSGYSFNKAHSWSYSWIGYMTAYYKANYPLEFYSVSLNESLEKTTSKDNPTEKLLREAQNYGIKIVLPNCSNSSVNCTIRNGGITFGLNMVKGLSEKVAELICSKEFKDFTEFVDFVLEQPKLNKRHVQILLKLGYFDPFPGTVYDKYKYYQLKVWEKENNKKRQEWEEKKGAGRRVREFNELKYEEEQLDGNKNDWQKELLGFDFETKLQKLISKIPEDIQNDDDYIIGEVTNIKTGMSKGGRAWCLVTLNTKNGETKGFIKNPQQERVFKGEVIYTLYSQGKSDAVSFYNIRKVI